MQLINVNSSLFIEYQLLLFLSYVTVFQCVLWRSHKAGLTVIKPVVCLIRPYFNIPFECRTKQVWAYSWPTLYFLDPRIESIFSVSNCLSYVTVFQCVLWRSHKAGLTVIKPVVGHYLVLYDRISIFPLKVALGRFELILDLPCIF